MLHYMFGTNFLTSKFQFAILLYRLVLVSHLHFHLILQILFHHFLYYLCNHESFSLSFHAEISIVLQILSTIDLLLLYHSD